MKENKVLQLNEATLKNSITHLKRSNVILKRQCEAKQSKILHLEAVLQQLQEDASTVKSILEDLMEDLNDNV